MNAAPQERGTALLSAHCRNLDPLTPTARERLEDELGYELTRRLVSALAPSRVRDSELSRRVLGARPVFAA